jgi:hypothetical protein
LTVATETPTISAVSSILHPPKYLISTTLACCGELGQRDVQLEQVDRRVIYRYLKIGMYRDDVDIAAAFFAVAAAGVVDKYTPHHLRRERIEMASVFPVGLALSGEFQIRLMHQCRGSKRVVAAFPPQLTAGPPPQLVVNDRDQAVPSVDITAIPGGKHPADILSLPVWVFHLKS